MTQDLSDLKKHLVENILSKQDNQFRWGFDEKKARERPEYVFYSPNYRSTLWTLVLLADLQAPIDHPGIQAAIQLITDHFYDPEHGIFRLPNEGHFPIPCLNGNMLYLHAYFKTVQSNLLDSTVDFFATYQRFDDGDFKTPLVYPYNSNTSCYGNHTCYWGVIKLLKGISFIPKNQRTKQAQALLQNCINFVLQHEVCFSSHKPEKLLHRDIDQLSFPNFYKSDLLEILWLLVREGVHDKRVSRSLALLRSKMKKDGTWILEKSINTVVSTGQKGHSHPFITERAVQVLKAYAS